MASNFYLDEHGILRRKFLKASSLIPLTLLGLNSFQESQAFWFALFMRAAAGTAARSTVRAAVSSGVRSSVTSSVGRYSASAATRSAAARYTARSTIGSNSSRASTIQNGTKSVAKSSIIADAVTEELASLAVQVAAEAIWVKQDQRNEAFLTISNPNSNSVKLTNLYLIVEDVNSGEIELEKNVGLIQAKPNTEGSFKMLVRDLPYDGVKRIYARSGDQKIECIPSGNILVI